MAFIFHHLKIYYLNNEKWKLAPYEPAKLVAKINEWQSPVQAAGGWLANFLNNHDQPRALSRFGDSENYRFELATSLAAVVLLLRWTPYLYQGEEFGMENNNYTKIEQLKDVELIFNFVENSWWNKKNHQYDNFKRKLYKLLILLFNFFIR